jgi:hypothetical protein
VTHKFAKHLIFAVSAVALTVAAANATESCLTGNVEVLAPPTGSPDTVCTMGGLTFSWDALTYTPATPASTLDISTPYSGIYGDDYSLYFTFSAGNSPQDINMTYEVQSTSANITQVDGFLEPTSDETTTPSIGETVCGNNPALDPLGQCNDVLATYTNLNTSGGVTYSESFAPQSTIWIIKDIQAGSPLAISYFGDSVVATPEPASLGLLLLAAFGMVVSARKLRKA